MGLLDKRNIDKVRALAEKNKEKIADGVSKATAAIDKKTDGKYSDKLKKIDEAAKKHGSEADAADDAADVAADDAAGAAVADATTDSAATTDDAATDAATKDGAGS